ncbi:hypothetical protein ABZ897_58650 [Nonomuraea sp. NPDC046802]|uniref:hypothetical protein n=1 Tax=Nonomuraea sp. NPDC046802 TaxID=3154919 RepID=UPI0033EA6AB7
MFVYALAQPIDLFDGLIPLPQWVSTGGPERTSWALQAVLALADAMPRVDWDGDMRHLPSIGALPTPNETSLFMVIKQDNNGTTFVISDDQLDWLLPNASHYTEVTRREIGPWEHTIRADVPDLGDLHPPARSALAADLSF